MITPENVKSISAARAIPAMIKSRFKIALRTFLFMRNSVPLSDRKEFMGADAPGVMRNSVPLSDRKEI
jgi:hypothetical protein